MKQNYPTHQSKETLSKQSNLKERFDEYHKENPHIYHQFRYYTLKAIQSGYKHFGSQMIIERIRWKTGVVSKNSDFKINNDYAAFYSRMFMAEYPSYSSYFRTRNSIADKLNND
jgi:hypothetical protein